MKASFGLVAALILASCPCALPADDLQDLRKQAISATKKAASYYHGQVASHGGYVYFYSLDLQQRWGEGPATKDQIWIQPPGTPTVGLAYLSAFQATGDRFFLDAARDAAMAVAYGQLKSGGWTNLVDFDPRSARASAYRNGKGRGKNNSSLDDGQTQSAIQLLIHVDRALGFRDKSIHEAADVALDALLKAQFPNGAFPQVWDGDPLPDPPARPAAFPDYDWRSEGRIKNYWEMYTLNDNVAGYVADTLIAAHAIYQQQRFLDALSRMGDFLVSAQMPEPQPGWAQQYNYEMQPIWARKFEPPGVSGDESQEVIQTLMKISVATGQRKYLDPIPRALAYLKRSLLEDGRLARYYELRTNKPLYMVRHGKDYALTYDDSNLPAHYGWKWDSQIAQLEAAYERLRDGTAVTTPPRNDDGVRRIISELDASGRWISTYGGERLVGQAKFPLGAKYLSSELFSRNLTELADFLIATR